MNACVNGGWLSLAVLLSAALGGCSGPQRPGEAAPPEGVSATAAGNSPDEVQSQHLSLEEATGFCVRLHEQLGVCPGEFIDLMLALRAKYDPAFAELLQDPAQRALIREEGIRETLADGTGPLEPRQAKCAEYAAHGPPVPRTDVGTAEGCYAEAACTPKLSCLQPLLETRLAAKATERKKKAGKRGGWMGRAAPVGSRGAAERVWAVPWEGVLGGWVEEGDGRVPFRALWPR